MTKKLWMLNPNKTSEEYHGCFIGDLDDYGHWYEVTVKWDGCIHFNKAGNSPFSEYYGFSSDIKRENECDDYIHICDLERHILLLTELLKEAKEYFTSQSRPRWPRQISRDE